MKTLIRQVVRIETAGNKSGGEYQRAIIQTKEGEQKLPLFGELAEQIKVPGSYKIQYDDEGKFWKAVCAELQSTPAELATMAQNASKSTGNGPGSGDSVKNREIRGAVILKACSEYLAASVRCQEITETAFEEKARHAFNVFQTLLEAYVADKKPDFENVAAR